MFNENEVSPKKIENETKIFDEKIELAQKSPQNNKKPALNDKTQRQYHQNLDKQKYHEIKNDSNRLQRLSSPELKKRLAKQIKLTRKHNTHTKPNHFLKTSKYINQQSSTDFQPSIEDLKKSPVLGSDLYKPYYPNSKGQKAEANSVELSPVLKEKYFINNAMYIEKLKTINQASFNNRNRPLTTRKTSPSKDLGSNPIKTSRPITSTDDMGIGPWINYGMNKLNDVNSLKLEQYVKEQKQTLADSTSFIFNTEGHLKSSNDIGGYQKALAVNKKNSNNNKSQIEIVRNNNKIDDSNSKKGPTLKYNKGKLIKHSLLRTDKQTNNKSFSKGFSNSVENTIQLTINCNNVTNYKINSDSCSRDDLIRFKSQNSSRNRRDVEIDMNGDAFAISQKKASFLIKESQQDLIYRKRQEECQREPGQIQTEDDQDEQYQLGLEEYNHLGIANPAYAQNFDSTRIAPKNSKISKFENIASIADDSGLQEFKLTSRNKSHINKNNHQRTMHVKNNLYSVDSMYDKKSPKRSQGILEQIDSSQFEEDDLSKKNPRNEIDQALLIDKNFQSILEDYELMPNKFRYFSLYNTEDVKQAIAIAHNEQIKLVKLFERIELFLKDARDSLCIKKQDGNWGNSGESNSCNGSNVGQLSPVLTKRNIYNESLLKNNNNFALKKIAHHIKQLKFVCQNTQQTTKNQKKEDLNSTDQNLKLICWNCGKVNITKNIKTEPGQNHRLNNTMIDQTGMSSQRNSRVSSVIHSPKLKHESRQSQRSIRGHPSDRPINNSIEKQNSQEAYSNMKFITQREHSSIGAFNSTKDVLGSSRIFSNQAKPGHISKIPKVQSDYEDPTDDLFDIDDFVKDLEGDVDADAMLEIKETEERESPEQSLLNTKKKRSSDDRLNWDLDEFILKVNGCNQNQSVMSHSNSVIVDNAEIESPPNNGQYRKNSLTKHFSSADKKSNNSNRKNPRNQNSGSKKDLSKSLADRENNGRLLRASYQNIKDYKFPENSDSKRRKITEFYNNPESQCEANMNERKRSFASNMLNFSENDMNEMISFDGGIGQRVSSLSTERKYRIIGDACIPHETAKNVKRGSLTHRDSIVSARDKEISNIQTKHTRPHNQKNSMIRNQKGKKSRTKDLAQRQIESTNKIIQRLGSLSRGSVTSQDSRKLAGFNVISFDDR